MPSSTIDLNCLDVAVDSKATAILIWQAINRRRRLASIAWRCGSCLHF